ncbi:MAG: DUF2752 domain-containing protein [Gemmataceae bacterium]
MAPIAMIVRPRLRPFESPRDRAARLVWVALLSLAYLGLAVWDPVTTPGPACCAMRHAVALPCPLCGCTRGVALCLRGRPVEATVGNPLSLPAALGGLVLVALWSFEYLKGAEVEFVWRRPWRRVFLAGATLALIATWVYLLAFRREDDFAASWLGRLLG